MKRIALISSLILVILAACGGALSVKDSKATQYEVVTIYTSPT